MTTPGQLSFLRLLDEPARARRSDPETSHKAKAFRLNEDRIAVILVYGLHPVYGLTDYELAAIMGRQQNSVGKRRGELRDYGFIEETALKRLAPSGARCIVWRITQAGKDLCQRLNAAKA